jgi:hypothetical protein
VESVLSQDFTDFEFVVCTAAYLHRVAAADRRVGIIHNEINVNSVAISLGRCLQQSNLTRSSISWMFDDCILLPGALSRLVAALNAHPGAGMVYGLTEVMLKDGNLPARRRIDRAGGAGGHCRLVGSSAKWRNLGAPRRLHTTWLVRRECGSSPLL